MQKHNHVQSPTFCLDIFYCLSLSYYYPGCDLSYSHKSINCYFRIFFSILKYILFFFHILYYLFIFILDTFFLFHIQFSILILNPYFRFFFGKTYKFQFIFYYILCCFQELGSISELIFLCILNILLYLSFFS